jgi:hypothetical protein
MLFGMPFFEKIISAVSLAIFVCRMQNHTSDFSFKKFGFSNTVILFCSFPHAIWLSIVISLMYVNTKYFEGKLFSAIVSLFFFSSGDRSQIVGTPSTASSSLEKINDECF